MTHVADERLGRFACQQADLFRRVREGSVDIGYASGGVQRIMEHKLPEQEAQTFTLRVNYDQSVEEALTAGSYDLMNNDLTSEHFLPTRRGIEQVELKLIHFGRQMTSDEVTTELDKQGLRQATIEELLALGADLHTQDLQRQFSIIALGSVWTSPSGNRRVPVLWGDDRERCAGLRWFAFDWRSDYRFAAVSKYIIT